MRIDYTSTTGGTNWATELANAQEAIAAGSNVKVFATPWTPPIAWKSNDALAGGTLNGFAPLPREPRISGTARR